ncbi:hypothetical protein HDR58_07425 [bacterium]|nr:hypothetical protein [bacterium]
MVETAPIKPFTTISYTTKDGEKITATKNDGIVTIVGDKNGTRQMPLEEFKTDFLENAVKLEKTPEADTVELSTTPEIKKADSEVKPEQKIENPPKETGNKLDVAA